MSSNRRSLSTKTSTHAEWPKPQADTLDSIGKFVLAFVEQRDQQLHHKTFSDKVLGNLGVTLSIQMNSPTLQFGVACKVLSPGPRTLCDLDDLTGILKTQLPQLTHTKINYETGSWLYTLPLMSR